MTLGKEIGSISVGKRADLSLINTRNLGMFPVNDPVAQVVQSATPSDVDTVIADGQILKRNGRLVTVDVAQLSAQATAGVHQLL
ncbi:amidohydrolase family protein [Pseudomonas sp. S44]|uniref:amidohydrolase family protein n=1 Tax=Pseudomonas sp. S44 TaxID=2767450 RepID=UPI00190D3FF3|nr:amidohydrolase family protein [Pseudomonas sp. S44]